MSTTRDKTMRDWCASEPAKNDNERKMAKQIERIRIKCNCGWKGKLGDLVTDPESDDQHDMRCPVCDGAWSWVYV